MSTCKTYLDYIRSGKIPSMILELPCTSRLELASGVVTCQRKHRSNITRKSLENSATETGKTAGIMTWRLLTRYLAQMSWRSSGSPWKLSGISGRLIRP
jgi:hypothetical protein